MSKKLVGVLYGMLLNDAMHKLLAGPDGLVERFEQMRERVGGRELEAWERISIGSTSNPGYVGYMLFLLGEDAAKKHHCAELRTMPLGNNLHGMVTDLPQGLVHVLNSWTIFETFCRENGVKVRAALQLVVDEEPEEEKAMPGVDPTITILVMKARGVPPNWKIEIADPAMRTSSDDPVLS